MFIVVFWMSGRFNADISKWNTESVTSMFGSKLFLALLSLSLFVFCHAPFAMRVLRISLSTLSWILSVFKAYTEKPSSRFNADISKWNTSRVRNMGDSKRERERGRKK